MRRMGKGCLIFLVVIAVIYCEAVEKCDCVKGKLVESTCVSYELNTCLVEKNNPYAAHSFTLSREDNKITARTYLGTDLSCHSMIAEGVLECNKCEGTTMYRCRNWVVIYGSIGSVVIVFSIFLAFACTLLCCFAFSVCVLFVLYKRGILGGRKVQYERSEAAFSEAWEDEEPLVGDNDSHSFSNAVSIEEM